MKELTYYEKIAKTRWVKYITNIEKKVLLKANNLAKRPTKVLDIGCDGGRWSKLLSDIGWNPICIDINKNSLEICKKRIPKSRCILVDKNQTKYPFSSRSIKLILCIEVLVYIPDKEKFIDEAFRLLSSEGLFIGTISNSFSIRRFFYWFLSLFDIQRREFRIKNTAYKINYSKFRRKILNKEFKIIYEEGFCWLPFSRQSNFFLIPYLVKIEKYMGLRKWIRFSPWIIFIAQKNKK